MSKKHVLQASICVFQILKSQFSCLHALSIVKDINVHLRSIGYSMMNIKEVGCSVKDIRYSIPDYIGLLLIYPSKTEQI